MGNFPLIQQSSPLEDLAGVLGRIRDRHVAAQQVAFDRQQTLAHEQRSNAYLALNQREADQRDTAEAWRQKQDLQANTLAQAQFQEALRQHGVAEATQQAEMRAASATGIATLAARFGQLVTPGAATRFAAQDARAQQGYPGGVQSADLKPDLAMSMMQAGERMTPDVEGSVLRRGHAGQSNGVVAMPSQQNANFPSNGGGSGGMTPGALKIEEYVNSVHNAREGVNRMRDLIASHGVEVVGRTGATLAGDLARHIGPGSEAAVRQSMLPRAGLEFQSAADQVLHNLASWLPSGSRSIAILQNFRDAYIPGSGLRAAQTARRFWIAADAAVKQAEGGPLYQRARAMRSDAQTRTAPTIHSDFMP